MNKKGTGALALALGAVMIASFAGCDGAGVMAFDAGKQLSLIHI